MKKKKVLILSTSLLMLFATATATLLHLNLENNYKKDDYVKKEDAYFVTTLDNEDGLVKAKKFLTPSDSKYNEQKTRSLGTDLIGDIESVWDSYTGKGTTIAIIDDGFDYNHPEYIRADGTSAILDTSRSYYTSGSNVYYKTFQANPENIAQDWEYDSYDNSYSWATHGTATSTTAAAPINNEGGVGIAPDASILALKIDFYLSSIGSAIDYAISQKVDVINMSLGAYAENFTDGFGDKQTGDSSTATYLNAVCKRAYDAGIIVVAAAGNEATYRKSYPASNYKVIGVGALGDYDNKGNSSKLAEFTNYVSPSQTGEINVDILAPGYVYTAHQAGTQSQINHTYSDTQGTSFSSPIVAGAAALWKEKNVDGTPSEFLEQLQASADDIGLYKNKMVPVSGYGDGLRDVGPSNIENGRLNVAKLLTIDEPEVSLLNSSINVSVNETTQIKLKTSNGILSYTSSDPNIASVSNKGVITGVSQGNTTITVTASLNGKTASKIINVEVLPIIAVSSMSFVPNTKTLNVGQTYDAKETITTIPTNASAIFLFESNDESVATIDIETGIINAVGAGVATIDSISVYGNGEATLQLIVEDSIAYDGEINFGKAVGSTNINSTSVSGVDSLNNRWDINTTGSPTFTPANEYSQIGSKNNPATKIEFKLQLTESVTFSNIKASFGGFSDTSGDVVITVDFKTVGSGKLSGKSDIHVSSNGNNVGKTLTISISNISKGVKAYSISYTYKGAGGEVDPPEVTLENVDVTNVKTYHPGDKIFKNDIKVILNYSDGTSKTTTDFIFENDAYAFTYDDIAGGNLAKSMQFSISYEGQSYPFTVKTSRLAYIQPSSTTKTLSSTEFADSNLSKKSGTNSPTLVTIGGQAFTVSQNAYVFSQSSKNYVSFGKTAGLIKNSVAFDRDLTSASVDVKSDSRKDGSLTVSKDGTNWEKHSVNILSNGGYRYFKYEFVGTVTGSGASTYSNIETISFSLSGLDNALNISNYIMYEDTNNQCLTKLNTTLEKLNQLSNAEKNVFWTSEDYVIKTARERMIAWSRHEGRELSFEGGSFSARKANDFYALDVVSNNNFGAFIVILLIGGATIGAYYFQKRKNAI